ncbi:MAG TPA: hypothetical protein VGB73_08365 [Pyrinomonadaceae bacterium]|jgi:uncharacterized membrane protein YeaQ/YmgE (transglycosylase-associated protein family)
MNFTLFALWALVGWCSTPWPRSSKANGDPHPWIVIKIAGVIGGIVGGLVFTQLFDTTAGPDPIPWRAIYAAATSVGAFVGARLVEDLYRLARGATGGRTARG